ncbi:MAG: ASKHA domain-containing protein [Terriglobia bacterium]
MAESEDLVALADLGTDGEIVVGNRSRLMCASTAAGPAFEAGRIRMGMRAAAGAITGVSLRQGRMHCHVLGEGPARGLRQRPGGCGRRRAGLGGYPEQRAF